MSEQQFIRPMGPLQEGDQAIIDALHRIPTDVDMLQVSHEAVVVSFTGARKTTPGLPKDHWSVASVDTDGKGNPLKSEATLLHVSAKDINVTLRGGNIDKDVRADTHGDIRTEEDKPKATDRAKLHDRDTEQSIKLLTAERLNRAAETIVKIKGLPVTESPDTKY